MEQEISLLYTPPMKYMKEMIDIYQKMFREKAKTIYKPPPLESGDHPELDQSKFLDLEGIHEY